MNYNSFKAAMYFFLGHLTDDTIQRAFALLNESPAAFYERYPSVPFNFFKP